MKDCSFTTAEVFSSGPPKLDLSRQEALTNYNKPLSYRTCVEECYCVFFHVFVRLSTALKKIGVGLF